MLRHLLVAGQLDVPAQEHIAQPQGGVEPVDRQQQKAQGLPPVIPAADVGALMGEDMAADGLVQTGRQVDVRAEQTKEEGGVDPVAEENARLQQHGFAHLPPDAQAGYQRPERHGSHAQKPEVGEDGNPDLQGIDTGAGGGAQGLGIDGVHGIVNA